jgi:hypothetical protein
MKKILIIAMFVICITSDVYSQVSSSDDCKEDPTSIPNQLIQLKGKVEIADKNNNKSVRVGAYIVFQKAECKKCLVATYSNSEGDYSILLGQGKYKVFIFEGPLNGQFYNALAPEQEHYVQTKAGERVQNFNIKIKLREPSVILDESLDGISTQTHKNYQ